MGSSARVLRSGLRDRPEDNIRRLAAAAPRRRAVTVPGAHAFVHPRPDLVSRLAAQAAGASRPAGHR